MSNNKFPNGFTSWYETFFEISAYMIETCDVEGTIAHHYEMIGGRGMLYEIAHNLTDEFEYKHQLKNWDGEFFDYIDEFMKEKNRKFNNPT
jgi:hypothetical protein